MQIVHLCATDDRGGAARAAYRIHQGLLRVGADSLMMVQIKTSRDPTVIGPESSLSRLWAGARRPLDRLPLVLSRRGLLGALSPQWLPERVASRVNAINPDVIHLHFICDGSVRIESLRVLASRPMVWTMHDMWPFTGGCHYDRDCGRYADACGRCPLLGSSSAWDLSRWVMRRKRRAWSRVLLHPVAPSRWLAERARASRLFRDRTVRVIPYGLDLEVFRPLERSLARRVLGLPPDPLYLLFGAAELADERKGWHLLKPALRRLADDGWRTRVELLVVGAGTAPAMAELGLKAHALGALQDELTMALALAAADVVAVPSTQDNLPNVAVEALACGRPCVGFRVGGLPDIIEHERNGFLARSFDPEQLAAGLRWVLEDGARWNRLSLRAREKAARCFDSSIVAHQYIELYRSLGVD